MPSPGTTAATLLLNATYEPLCVVSSRRAIVLVLAEKAESVDTAADVVHSEMVSLPVPVVDGVVAAATGHRDQRGSERESQQMSGGARSQMS